MGLQRLHHVGRGVAQVRGVGRASVARRRPAATRSALVYCCTDPIGRRVTLASPAGDHTPVAVTAVCKRAARSRAAAKFARKLSAVERWWSVESGGAQHATLVAQSGNSIGVRVVTGKGTQELLDLTSTYKDGAGECLPVELVDWSTRRLVCSGASTER